MSAIAVLAEELSSGARTAVALARLAFRLAEEDRAIFTLRDEPAALSQAAEADRLRAAGDPRPLLGVPVTVKDNFDLAGQVTTAGSVLLAGAAPAATDAEAVARLRKAGMVVLGRTGMTEFAFSGLGLNPHYGTPLNPAYPDERRIAGGSSSGAAASVVRGLVPAALGTDTGGSIRVPAAFCGLVGFKPTAKEVPQEGVLPLSTTLDSVGVVATSVADCRRIFELIRDGRGVETAPVDRPIHLGVVSNYVREDEDPEVGQAFSAALVKLAVGGVRLSTIEVAALETISLIAPRASFSAVEAAAWHRAHLFAGRSTSYDPRVLARILPGTDIDAAEVAAMVARRADFVAALAAAGAPFDALVWPTVPMLAPLLDDLVDDARYHAANVRALRNPSIVNLADGCAISLPCHKAGAPPVGLTLAGPGSTDDHLLDVALAVEAVLKRY